MFLCKIKDNYSNIIPVIPSYLEHCLIALPKYFGLLVQVD